MENVERIRREERKKRQKETHIPAIDLKMLVKKLKPQLEAACTSGESKWYELSANSRKYLVNINNHTLTIVPLNNDPKAWKEITKEESEALQAQFADMHAEQLGEC